MPYITREDGEHFVIPSYRDVLTVKQQNQLKKDILLLSQSYGSYITMQKKGANTYELAFSPDAGYLLGETIWHYFKRPLDMVYCEAIPGTTEAILVIVKGGSVYLDGRFPLDSIPEELIIFLTQQNNFEIYVYGDVPISQTAEEGKFSFEASSIKSFAVLDKPAFAVLPLLKAYQLQLVEPLLKAQGIGVFPTKQLVSILVLVALAYFAWMYISKPKVATVEKTEINPYLVYNQTLNSPAPEEEISQFLNIIRLLYTMPGWVLTSGKYAKNEASFSVQSSGGKVEDLMAWAKNNDLAFNIKSEGFAINKVIIVPKRPNPNSIYPLKQVIAQLVDKISLVYPGNHLSLGDFKNRGVYTDVPVTIRFDSVSPVIVALIANQLRALPFVLQNIVVTADKSNNLSGSFTIQALGSQQ